MSDKLDKLLDEKRRIRAIERCMDAAYDIWLETQSVDERYDRLNGILGDWIDQRGIIMLTKDTLKQLIIEEENEKATKGTAE